MGRRAESSLRMRGLLCIAALQGPKKDEESSDEDLFAPGVCCSDPVTILLVSQSGSMFSWKQHDSREEWRGKPHQIV